MTWLGNNRWYLVAVAVLLPGALVIALNAGWFDYLDSRNGRPIAAQAGQSVEYAGAQWSLLETYTVDSESDRGQEAGLLPGTSLVSATIAVRPGEGEPPSCTFELWDASGTRSWDEALDSDADVSNADGTESYCSLDAEGPYRVQVFFVVPDDATQDMRLAVYQITRYPDLILFDL